MQPKLPDLNAAIVTHRRTALWSFSHGKFDETIIAIRAIIALMPKEYQLEISTEKYKQKVRFNTMHICKYCDEENNADDLRIYKNEYPNHLAILFKAKTFDFWICQKCQGRNKTSSTSSVTEEDDDPNYYKVVPEPPLKTNIFERTDYDDKFREWFRIVVPELEHQISRLRTEYTPTDEAEIDEDGDEFDEDFDPEENPNE